MVFGSSLHLHERYENGNQNARDKTRDSLVHTKEILSVGNVRLEADEFAGSCSGGAICVSVYQSRKHQDCVPVCRLPALRPVSSGGH